MPTHYTGDERTRRALDAYIKLSRARKMMGMQTSRLMAEYGLTESQLGTLEALYYLGSMCQKDIGDKLLVTGGNMTMVITNLERRGLVSRKRDDADRRQIIVSLTEEGQQLLDELFPRHAQYITELMSILSPQEQDQLGRLCKMLGLQAREDNGTV
jgi:MarR family 2-MHQ and catechol resistance regulon transcriptional repressor